MEPVNLLEYEPLARQKLSESAYGFIAGAAEDEVSLRENRAAFQRLRLRPRGLVDVSKIDPSTPVLGQRVGVPVPPRPAPAPDREGTRRLVGRAEAHGSSALCLTVDRPCLGRRETDIRNRLQFPPDV